MTSVATRKKAKAKIPPQAVANLFVISRVPEAGWITYGDLMKAVEKDAAAAEKHGFSFRAWSKLTPRALFRYLVDKRLLSCELASLVLDNKPPEILARLRVSQNDRTKRYTAKTRPEVHAKLERLPISNILLLIAGAAGSDG
jgi:hypothetical protein